MLQCCTPGFRKTGGTHLVGKPPRRRERGTPARSLSTVDIADSSIIPISSSRTEPLFKPEVVLLSYNIFMRPDLPISFTPEYQELRISLFVQHVLPAYDIVCLQEMFNMPLSSRRRLFVEEARALGYHWSHHSSRTYSFSPTIDGGLLVLSKLPIVKTDIFNFSTAAFADWYASKGVLYCLIQVGPNDGHFIHLFCTHLQATYDEKGRKLSERVRKEQLKQTSEFVNKCVDGMEGWPIVICGDLNVQCRKSSMDGSDSPEYLDMMSTIRKGLGMKGELMRDLTLEIDGVSHPITYGDAHIDQDGNVHPREVSLTDVDDLKKSMDNCNQSLDKIFWVPATERVAQLEPAATTINPILIHKDSWNIKADHPLTHLSDHYGIETRIRVKGMPSIPQSG